MSSVTRMRDGGSTTIVFDLDGALAQAYFPVNLTDAGGVPGPATLLTVADVITPITRLSGRSPKG